MEATSFLLNDDKSKKYSSLDHLIIIGQTLVSNG